MAVTHVATSTNAAGTTSAAPTYPAGIAADDAIWLGAVACHSSIVTYPTISGYTLLYDVALGGGTIGAGTGPRRLGLYRKDTVLGTETGTVTVTPTGGSDVVMGCLTVWRVAAGKTFAITYETGQDTSPGTATSITAGSVLGETAGDFMLGLIGAPANSNMSGQTFTATGATYGTATERSDSGSNNGDDCRLAFVSRDISSGTASAATVYSASSTQSAGCIFIRIHEADPPSTRLPRSRQLWIPRAARQRAAYAG